MPSSGGKTCRSEEHTSELQSHDNLVCRLLLEKKKHTSEHAPSAHAPTRTREPQPAARRRRAGAVGAGAGAVWGEGSFLCCAVFFFFKDRGTPEFYPFPLPGAFPI